MTILTKPSNEKKPDKVPIVVGADDDAMLHAGGVAEGTLLHQRSCSVSSEFDTESLYVTKSHLAFLKTSLFVFVAMIVLIIGILGGFTLYHLYSPNHIASHFRARCAIPYELNNLNVPRMYSNGDLELNWQSLFPGLSGNEFGEMADDKYFREDIELDMSDNESYAKIDVPDFKDGRRGRFMHDFKDNQSAIIDTTANRCFIMQLDRDTTLPPRSFLDLMQKMGSGYYNIDTDRVRRKMRVVMPPITDLTLISERIANECFDMKVYMLENYVSGIFKREVKEISDSGKFAEFSGKGIVEFDLFNIKDVENYELQQQK